VSSLNNTQHSIGFQVQFLQVELTKLVQFRTQLGEAISFYQTTSGQSYNKIETPSNFFVEL